VDLSPIGRAVLISREGERLEAYQDSQSVWTIGVGITTASGLITVHPGLIITKAQSDELFAKAVEKYVEPIRKALTREVPQELFDALVSLCFNCGPKVAQSTAVKRANFGDYKGAAEAILLWNKPAAILPRRQAERDQALTPYSVSLPKARRTDRNPVKVPAAAAPAPAPLGPPPAPPAPAPTALQRFLAWLRF
jgi:lysozyme